MSRMLTVDEYGRIRHLHPSVLSVFRMRSREAESWSNIACVFPKVLEAARVQ